MTRSLSIVVNLKAPGGWVSVFCTPGKARELQVAKSTCRVQVWVPCVATHRCVCLCVSVCVCVSRRISPPPFTHTNQHTLIIITREQERRGTATNHHHHHHHDPLLLPSVQPTWAGAQVGFTSARNANTEERVLVGQRARPLRQHLAGCTVIDPQRTVC
jgi:hypothetical protein